MADLALATQVATLVSGIVSAIQLGISVQEAESNLDKRVIQKHAKILVSTYEDDELAALHDRIKECRKKFINEGDGSQRVRCICSVLKDAITGNGGVSPISAWDSMYKQLC